MIPKAKRIFETVLYARDLMAMEQFYRDVFGLDVIGRSELAVAFRCGGGVLLIFNPDLSGRPNRDVPSHGSEGLGHVAFATPAEDFDSWREHLRTSAVEIEKEVDWDEGGRSIYVRDPAGNSVELAPSTIWGGGWNF